MSSLYALRDCDLGADLACKLAPFVQAWRPHTDVPTRNELQAAGYEKVKSESFLDDLTEEYFELHGYYPGEEPEGTA